jgi:methionine aminopeptidase
MINRKYVKEQNLSVCDAACGHGIGKKFHESPLVEHCGKKKMKK